MSQEYLLEYKNLTKQVIDKVKEEIDIKEITCLVPKDEDSASKLLSDNGFKYIGTRTVDGEKLTVLKWFKDLKPGYEDMAAFFDRRVEDYDEHMRGLIYYEKILKSLASNIISTKDMVSILDLGCGTGVELEYVFEKVPNAQVDCVDMSHGMLEKLKEKYAGKSINIVCASYTEIDFGEKKYDYVLACNTLHHLKKEEKLTLYKGIKTALKKNGLLLIADYVVSQEEENDIREKYQSLVKSETLKKGEWYHIDLALSESSERELLDKALFNEYKLDRCGENGVEIVARK